MQRVEAARQSIKVIVLRNRHSLANKEDVLGLV